MSTPIDQLPEITVTSQSLASAPTPATTLQYLRKFSLNVSGALGAGLDFAEFRCTFAVRRGDIQTPNSCDARIYNLKNDTARRLLGNEFTTVTIKAGYEGNFAQIFQGSIKQTRKGRIDGRDSYVDITAADGDHAYNFATISQPLVSASDASVMKAIQGALANFNVTTGTLPVFAQAQLPRGKVMYGTIKDQLREIANNNDCVWSIQDGALTMIPKTAYIASPPLVISSQNGLIGVPEQTANGIEVRTLLNPSIKIGTSIQLIGTINRLRYGLNINDVPQNLKLQQQVKTNADGLYYVMYVNHQGDSRGVPWFSDLICLAVDAGIPPDIDLSNRFFSATDSIPRVQ